MYNSTYAFQENKMGMGVELEGLELDEWDFDNGATAEREAYSEVSKEAMAGFAQIGAFFDNLFASLSVKSSKSIKKTTLGETTLNNKLTFEAGLNTEQIFTNYDLDDNGEINFNGDSPVIGDIKTEYYTETTLKTPIKVTPLLDLTLEGKVKTDLGTGHSSATIRGTLGIKGNGLYTSGTISTKGETKVEAGLRAQAKTPRVLGLSIEMEGMLGIRILLDD